MFTVNDLVIAFSVHMMLQAFQQYIEPSMQYADIVVPRGKLLFVCGGGGLCAGGKSVLLVEGEGEGEGYVKSVGGYTFSFDSTGAQNDVAMQLIVHHVKDQLKKV